MRVSFYLNSPKSKQSPVYISITKDKFRLRFPSGKTFLTDHVTNRKKKGKSFLVKGMPYYLNYSKILIEIEEELRSYEMQFTENNEEHSLTQIRGRYESKREPLKSTELDFFNCYDQFFEYKLNKLKEGTQNHYVTLRKHLVVFEKEVLNEKLLIQNVNEDTYRLFKDDYLVGLKKLSNSTSNQNLKKFKEFCKYAIKKEWITKKIHLDEFNQLKQGETFNIALKKFEVDALVELNLSNNERLDRVRDLFLLEIYTGQRYSDIPQVLGLSDNMPDSINLYQQKTFGKAYIPLHQTLIQHLNKIKIKNYNDVASLSGQKFNEYLKEVAKMIGMNIVHHWKILIGNEQIKKSNYRYNLVTSHVGRRTFCTLALKNKIPMEYIMRVTGHKSYLEFQKYIKLDDEDLNDAFKNFLID